MSPCAYCIANSTQLTSDNWSLRWGSRHNGEMRSPASASRIPELDGIRGIAITLVIGCHYHAFASMFGGLPKFGWVGVDLFFVLSGYLITTVLLDLKGSPDALRTFFVRRMRRILPPYALVLVAVLVLSLAMHVSTISVVVFGFLNGVFWLSWLPAPAQIARAWSAIISGAIPSLSMMHPLPLASSGFMAPKPLMSLSHFWSLSVEEWYYLLWAPIILALSRQTACVLIIVVSAACLFLRWFGFANWLWYIDIACRVDMILIGSGLALCLNVRRTLSRWQQRTLDRSISVITITASFSLSLLLTSLHPLLNREIRESVQFAVFGPLLIAIIVAGALAAVLRRSQHTSILCRILRHPVLTYTGRRSYMMYLVHAPVYYAIGRFLNCTTLLGAILSAGLTVILAAVSWKYLERPLLYRTAGALASIDKDAKSPATA